ncbi:MAG: LPS export ABC transporter permease LptF [Pseudomonadota bacterium]
MSLLGRYLNRELLGVFVMVLLVLFLVAVGGRFIGFLQDAAIGKYSAGSLFTLLGLRLPEIGQLLLPFALFLALLLTLGRLYAEQEMAVLFGGGAGAPALLRWLAPVIVAITAAVAMLSLLVTPSSNASLAAALTEERLDRDFANLTPGVFHVYARGDRVSYADALAPDGERLFEVFLAERRAGFEDVTVRAEEGLQYIDPETGSRFLRLLRGSRYEGQLGTGGYRVIEFDSMSQRIEIDSSHRSVEDVGARPTALLIGDDDAVARAELGWRWSMPLLTALSALLAIALARVKPRQGRFARLLPALGVFLLYYLSLSLIQNRLIEGDWPAWLSYWPAHGLFALLAIYGLSRIGSPQRT